MVTTNRRTTASCHLLLPSHDTIADIHCYNTGHGHTYNVLTDASGQIFCQSRQTVLGVIETNGPLEPVQIIKRVKSRYF